MCSLRVKVWMYEQHKHGFLYDSLIVMYSFQIQVEDADFRTLLLFLLCKLWNLFFSLSKMYINFYTYFGAWNSLTFCTLLSCLPLPPFHKWKEFCGIKCNVQPLVEFVQLNIVDYVEYICILYLLKWESKIISIFCFSVCPNVCACYVSVVFLKFLFICINKSHLYLTTFESKLHKPHADTQKFILKPEHNKNIKPYSQTIKGLHYLFPRKWF